MLLFFVFTLAGIGSGIYYLFAAKKFQFNWLLLSLWLLAVGVAQLRLSPLEKSWTWQFWLFLAVFWIIFLIAYHLLEKFWSKKITEKTPDINSSGLEIILTILTIFSIAANIYIFLKFQTLPLLSTIPDKMRFIINREVFGPIEYAALLPRIYIPLSFFYLLITKNTIKKWQKYLVSANIFLGLLILIAYASRLTIVIVTLLCYFGYLMMKIKTISAKQTIKATIVAMLIVLAVSTAIPAIRQFITYRDYQYAGEYNPFSYISQISEISLPKSLQFVIPLYLVPSFNLQALMRGLEFYGGPHFYGSYTLSVFDSLIKLFHLPLFNAQVDWPGIFLPWWVTATFIFGYFADFGLIGAMLAAVLWGGLLSLIYVWVNRRPSLLSIMLFAYFSFVAVMTIYTNYFGREEMYLDLFLFLLILIFLRLKPYNH